jgi:hypothetical protein
MLAAMKLRVGESVEQGHEILEGRVTGGIIDHQNLEPNRFDVERNLGRRLTQIKNRSE